MFQKLGYLKELLTFADKITIITIIVFSLGLIIATPKLIAEDTADKDVVITLDKQEIYRFDLENNSKLKKIEFDFMVDQTEYQGILKMRNGQVKLERLSEDISPLPIHANMGWISEPHQMIVCLPVKLAVTIEGDSGENKDIDLRTF